MYFNPQTVATVLAYLSSSAIAAPLEDRAVRKLDCGDIQQGIAPFCWDKLNVQGYILKFKETAFATTGPHPFKLCNAKDSWSTCFLRDSFGTSGRDCSKVNATNCAAPEAALGKLPSRAEMFYGSYSIWAIQHYISAWFNAISVLSTKNPGVILKAAQPVPEGGLTEMPAADSVDDALSNLILKDGVSDQSTALLKVLSETPSNATYTTPVNAGALATQMQTRLSSVLAAVQSNVTLFLDMASKGVFSDSDVTASVDIVATLCPGDACGTVHLD